MPSAFQLCGMPLRRPRSSRPSRKRRPHSPSPSPTPPLPPPLPLPLPLPLAAPPPLAATLSRFAEDAASTDGGLSDVDLSAVDLSSTWPPPAPPPHSQPRDRDRLPTPMVMDALSRKWVGNEPEFDGFKDAVRHAAGPDTPLPEDDAPFRIASDLERQWQSDATAHNLLFAALPTTHEADIRDLASEYQKRRKGWR